MSCLIAAILVVGAVVMAFVGTAAGSDSVRCCHHMAFPEDSLLCVRVNERT